jgi:succinyl-CoA synthetase alpha subunit
MAILIDERTRVVVQGITGNQGSFHTGQMLKYGTNIVAGVSPSKAGQREEHGIPVFAGVAEAVAETGADAAIVFVPARFAKDAAFEALAAGVRILVMIPEHIPVQDTIAILEYARYRDAVVVGPNTFGVISPGKSKMGIMPNHIYRPGHVGIVARSGTLSYEIAAQLTGAGFGQSTVVGMGGDPVAGLTFVEVLERLERDEETEAVVLVGEIGGRAEEDAAQYIRTMTKPVVAYLAGRAAPPGKRMGHAGAIIERGVGTLESKRAALTAAGAKVVDMPWQVPDALKEALAGRR